MTDAFPITLVGPSSKERKYDRQLRLWAASGQQALEQSRVLLVNSDGPINGENTSIGGVAGVETLKNLVLPGVGGFTIVDPATVTETDLGVNFFLEESSLGKSRAQETCTYLRELNPDVDGDYKVEPISELLKQPDFLSAYKIIIVSGPIKRSSLDALSLSADQLGVPLIYTRSVGFYSSFSLQLPAEFPIIETHPDPESTQDLRLLNPWPELQAAASALTDLDELDDHDHGHVPYILILLHYLEKWKAEHDGKVPETYKDKTAFREFVRAGARTNTAEGGEENFDEAVGAVLKSINPWSLRSNIREIFDMEQCKNIQPDSDNFWIIAAALKEFYAKHTVLPLPGSVPDMKARSADYISLQNIYKSKASRDVMEVVEAVRTLEAQLGSRREPVSEKEVEIFCKNASHVKVIYGRRIPHMTIDASQTLKAIRSSFGNPESIVSIYIAFEALDDIVDGIQNGRLPATALDDDATWETTLDRLINTIAEEDKTFLEDNNESVRESVANAAKELRRTEGGELHNISSLTGGLVSQEALKVLTRQYVPLDNTCIFDGIGSRSEMFRL